MKSLRGTRLVAVLAITVLVIVGVAAYLYENQNSNPSASSNNTSSGPKYPSINLSGFTILTSFVDFSGSGNFHFSVPLSAQTLWFILYFNDSQGYVEPINSSGYVEGNMPLSLNSNFNALERFTMEKPGLPSGLSTYWSFEYNVKFEGSSNDHLVIFQSTQVIQ